MVTDPPYNVDVEETAGKILGYDKDEFGNIFIVEEEAEVVRYIFKSYLNGISGPEIAKSLTSLGIPTVKGLTEWSPGAVYGILKNEKFSEMF